MAITIDALAGRVTALEALVGSLVDAMGRVTALEALVGSLVDAMATGIRPPDIEARKRPRPAAWDFTSMREAVDTSDNNNLQGQLHVAMHAVVGMVDTFQGQLNATMQAVFGEVVTEITDAGGKPKNAR